ncbi:hypothetical protein ACIQXU_16375 [Peribacillus sp. NPDC097284]|uniref:hypothetical protein n=1 Tax=Peribacillus sp. NPDC097284 TaxID=3364401 RepID=UPI0038279A5E
MAKGKVSIDVDMHTDKLQLKLRAISKHTAALADELDEIDKSICPECGDLMERTTFYEDKKVFHSTSICSNCIENTRSEM